jgi:hypothetical protein
VRRLAGLLSISIHFIEPVLQSLNRHFTAVASALNDTELPVRVHAALALTEILENHEKG